MDSNSVISLVSAVVAVCSLGYNIWFTRSRDRADRQHRIREEVQAAQKLRETVDLVNTFNDKLATNYDASFSLAGMAGGSQHASYGREGEDRRDELASIKKFAEDALAQNPQNLSDYASEITGHQERLDAMKEYLRTEIASVEANLRQLRRQA